MTAMVEVWGRMALRLANAEIYPLGFQPYATTVLGFIDSLEKIEGVPEQLDLTGARTAAEEWLSVAEQLQQGVFSLLTESTDTSQLAELNTTLLQIERAFLSTAGIPDRPWFKHVLYAPRYTYAAMSLPGVREAAEAGDWETARAQLDLLTAHLHAVTNLTSQAASQGDRIRVSEN